MIYQVNCNEPRAKYLDTRLLHGIDWHKPQTFVPLRSTRNAYTAIDLVLELSPKNELFFTTDFGKRVYQHEVDSY